MTKMAERTNVNSIDEFSTITSLLEYNEVAGEWGLDIFNGKYNECVENIKSGGSGYFEVDYDIPDMITAKFVMLS